MAKVSILIPVYNQENYLEKCMETVRRQTLPDIEIICVNDGSTDRSLAMLKEYAAQDARIVLLDGPNGGYGKAMNRALDAAGGEYIGIVEPDDYVPLEMYEDLYKIASENDLDFVKADFYRFQTDPATGDMQLAYNHLSPDKEDYGKIFNPSQDPKTLLYVMNTWSGIYRRDFLTKNHIRHNETPGASFQDTGFFFQTFMFAHRAMILDRPYYRNRRDNPNSSVKNPKKVYCICDEFDFIEKILRQDPERWERFKYAFTHRKYVHYVGNIRRIGDEFKMDFCRRFSAEMKRHRQEGTLRQSDYKEKDWDKIQLLLTDPQGYSYLYLNNAALMKAAEKIWNSNSYKLGYALTNPVRSVKKKLHRKK